MRVNEKMRKALSILLCLCMLLQNAPVMAFAATTDNLCDHHTEHTAECGYREGSEGSACTHKHSEACYKIVACKHTHDDTCSSGCSHTCTVENGCITMELDCRHVHGDCGYAEAVAPQDCTTCQPVLTHAENCGYVAPVAEVTCACVPGEDGTLVHTEGCGYVAPVEEVKCACVPTVTHGGEGCTYAEGKAGAPCTHTHAVKVDSADSCYKLLCSHKDGGHDDACGYAEAVEAHECHYECAECAAALTAEDDAEPTTEATTEPSTEATEPSTEATESTTETAPVCDCGTDDENIHATTCAVYVAPENPVCSCAEACGVETQNFWCDVCGFDYTACTGTDTAAVYAEGTIDLSQYSAGDTINITQDSVIVGDGNEYNISLNIAENATVTFDVGASGVKLGRQITVADGKTLTLLVAGDAEHTVNGSISLGNGSNVIIEGDLTKENNKLTVTATGSNAGIGANNGVTAGDITIRNARVDATGSGSSSAPKVAGAGIGTAKASMGNILIVNSIVTAAGGYYSEHEAHGAAIGMGSDGGTMGNITLIDSEITASHSGEGHASIIGAGPDFAEGDRNGSDIGTMGDIIITNTDLHLSMAVSTTDEYAAMIGTGDFSGGGLSYSVNMGKIIFTDITQAQLEKMIATWSIPSDFAEYGGYVLGLGYWTHVYKYNEYEKHCVGTFGGVWVSDGNGGIVQIGNDDGYYVDCKDGSFVHNFDKNCGVTYFVVHTEGTAATCSAKAVCSVCGKSYGDIDADAHSYGDWVSNGNGTHTRTCANDSTHTENGDCSGSTATCTTLAVCDICKTAYGELGGHTYNTAGSCTVCGAACPHSNFDPATGNCTDCETSLAIAKIKTGETTTYYQTADDLRTAISEILDDQTLTLLADFAVIGDLNFRAGGTENTLDLNGHTLTCDDRIMVENCKLTITGTDSSKILFTGANSSSTGLSNIISVYDEDSTIVVGSVVIQNGILRSVYGGVLDLTNATIPEAGLNVILYSDYWDPTPYNVSDVLLLPADYYFFVDGKAAYTYSGKTEGTVLKHTEHSYTYTDNGDGTHDATCSACGKMVDNEAHTFDQNDAGEWVCDCTAKAVASVTIENLTAYYANFADAVTMWAEHGDILTLLADVSYDSTINLGVNVSRTFVGGDYTLDLGSNNIVNYGTLTIQSGTIKTQFDTALAVYGPTTINSDNAELQGKSFQIMVHKPEALSITGTGCDGWRIWNNYNTQEAPITIPEGFHLEDEDGNQLAANDKLPVWEITVIKANHVHNWSYTADGSTITATCEGTIGSCSDKEQSFTLNASDAGYSGNPVEAEVTRDGTDLTFTLHYTGTNYDSAEAPTSAGDYTVTMTVGDKSVSDTFTISPKDISKVASCQFSLTQTSFVYSGKAPVLNVTGVDSSIGSYTMQEGTDYTVGIVQVNAGNHKLTVTGIGNYTGTVELAYTITAKEVSITGAVIQPVTYDPNGYTLTVTGVTFDGVVDGETLAYTAEATLGNTNAVGEQDATVTVTLDNSNYNLVTATYQTKVTINKAAATVTAAPTPNTLTYTGEGQYLISAGEANGGTMQYSTDNQTWSTTIPQGTDAGKYTVYYKVVGDENHSDTAVDSVEVTIAKADPVIGTVGCEMDLYDSTAISNVELTRTDMSVDGTLILTDSELTAGEGTYNWKFTPEDTDNYNTITGTVVLTVTADVLEQIRATGTLEKFSYVYGEPFSIDGMTVTASYTSGTTKDVTGLVSFDRTLAVGQTAVELTYQGKICVIDGITVARKQLDVSGMAWDVPENAVYSGTAYTATLTGDLPEGVTVIKTGDTATNVGGYTARAVFSLAEGYSADNYEIVNGEDLTAEWSIDKAALTVTADSYESVRYGSAAPAFAVNYSGFVNGETEAALGGELVFSCEYDTANAAKRKPGDYPIVPSGLTSNNYEISYVDGNLEVISANLLIVIDDKTVTYGDAAPEYTYHYEGFVYGEDISVMDELGTVSCAYVPGNAVGTMEIKSDNYGSDDCYFVVNQRIGTLTVEKASLTITAEDNSITYGDAPAANGVTGTGFVNGESFDDLSGELTYSYNYEQFGNVGTYKITPVGLTSDNYEITFADGTLTVNAKAITITADAVSKTYGDADPKLTYTAQGLVNGDELTGELKRVAGENVGDYAIEQNTLTAGNNYRLTYTGAKLTINAKAITAADVKLNGSLTYNGKEQTQAITVTEGITYEVTGNKATNVGTYELTVKGTGNYTGSVTLDWTIAKAKLTITADSKVIYIGEKLPTLTYTVSGLVGGDKLTKEPVLTTNADADQAGSYTITAANADAGMNYAITYVGGTLTIMDKNTEVETKVETAALTEVPDGLKNTKFNTLEAIKQELTSRIVATSTGFVKENMAHYDVTLQFSLDGGETWILATEENFPTEGITVTLPYPNGTNAAGYDFVVSHMFTVTSQRLGTTVGDVELPSVTETASGIRVTLKGLSPVTLAWRATEFDVKIAGTTNGTVSTNVSKAASGTEVTVTVTPKYGYKMATLTVKDANGKSYAVSTDNSGKYYFTMPAANVTVTATFSKISTSTADPTNPKTGDDFNIGVWSSVVFMSSLSLLAILVEDKRRRYTK